MTRRFSLNPPFRAEHVGSLLRPRVLKDAARAYREGTMGEDDYRAVLDREIARVVELQELVGLRSITDGEFGRSSWFGFFFERLDGFRLEPSRFKFHDPDSGDHEWLTCYTCAPIRRHRPICVDEFERLSALTRHTPKANMPSPSALHFFRGDQCRDPAVYPDIEQWWADLLAAYQAEIRALGEAGCTYLQLDEVPLAMLCDPDVRRQVEDSGADPARLMQRYIEMTNRALADRADDMAVAVHLCRGNFRSRWMASGGYEPIAEQLFGDLAVDAFFLEYDTSRAGDFGPLRFVPEDKLVVLGLITSKSAVLEDETTLKRRIDEASEFVPLERLALSPQCGFASVAGGNELTEIDEMAKLDLVVRVARDVWGEA